MRPYIIGRCWGKPKREGKKGKPKNHKFEALYNREGLGPPTRQQRTKREGKRKESPKIRNLRPYIIGRGWGPHPAAADQKRRKEKGKPQNQKFQALYNREGFGPPTRQQRTKRKGKRKESPKIRNLRPYIIGRGSGPPPGQQRTKRKGKKKESPKIRNLRPYIIGRGWGPHPAAERERKAQKSEI